MHLPPLSSLHLRRADTLIGISFRPNAAMLPTDTPLAAAANHCSNSPSPRRRPCSATVSNAVRAEPCAQGTSSKLFTFDTLNATTVLQLTVRDGTAFFPRPHPCAWEQIGAGCRFRCAMGVYHTPSEAFCSSCSPMPRAPVEGPTSAPPEPCPAPARCSGRVCWASLVSYQAAGPHPISMNLLRLLGHSHHFGPQNGVRIRSAQAAR